MKLNQTFPSQNVTISVDHLSSNTTQMNYYDVTGVNSFAYLHLIRFTLVKTTLRTTLRTC